MCEVELSCRLPLDSKNPSLPDWKYAPIVQRASTVAAGDYVFEISESVDFKEQFNKNGFSMTKIESGDAISDFTADNVYIRYSTGTFGTGCHITANKIFMAGVADELAKNWQ